MKLFACPGTCSLAPHIALHELGLTHEIEWVFLREGDGQKPEYLRINPIGGVPVLQMPNNEYLTEVQVILQYLADQKPESGLAPAPGSPERYRLQQWLSLISTELHKSFYPIFFARRILPEHEAAWEALVGHFRGRLEQRWQVVSDRLGDHTWVFGEHFTVADIYLYVVLVWWTKGLNFKLSNWPRLEDFKARVEARPAVQKALEKEAASSKA